MSSDLHVLYVGGTSRGAAGAVETPVGRPSVTTAETPADVREVLEVSDVDVVVVDRHSASPELLELIEEYSGKGTSLLVGTGPLDELLESIRLPGSEISDTIPDTDDPASPERVLDRLPDAFYVLDGSGELVYWNHTLSELTGYDDEEIDAMDAIEFFPESDREKISTAIEVVFSTDDALTVESALLTKADETIPCELNARRLVDETGAVVGLVGTARDIGTRQERERLFQSLHEATRRLQDVEDRETIAAHVASTAHDLLGLPTAVCWLRPQSGERALEPVAGDEGSSLDDQPVLRPGDPAWEVYGRGETALCEGEDCPIAGSERAILYPLGRRGVLAAGVPEGQTLEDHVVNAGRLLAAHASTALERVENLDRLRRNERELERQNERLEEFAAIVSHDLRNPLSVASGNLHLARQTDEERFFEAAADALGRMETLIDDLLALSRQGTEALEIAPVSLAVAAESAWSTVDTGNATLEVEGDGTLLADSGRLRQLLENLFGNSVEHGSTSSRAETDDSVEQDGPDVTVTVSVTRDGFRVCDDGPGIPEADRERVLEPGVTTSDSGTGFGLAIVREIAETHEWGLRITESENGGACFVFEGVEWTDVDD